MKLEEAIEVFDNIKKLYKDLDIIHDKKQCKELQAIETVLEALKNLQKELDETNKKYTLLAIENNDLKEKYII